MPFVVKMPKLSPTMSEGTIVKWHKKVGDEVKSQELLMEVATDKATVEYNAFDEGFLRKYLVEEGQSAAVGAPIAVFSKDKNESIDNFDYKEKPQITRHAKPEKAEHNATRDSQACNVAEAEGRAIQEPVFVPEPPLERVEDAIVADEVYQKILASPVAKKIAKEKNLDLTSIKGSGPNGRVVKRDLEFAKKDTAIRFGQKPCPKDLPGSYMEQGMTPFRKALATRMKQSKQFIPHFYISQEVDAAALVELRAQLKKENISLSVNDFIVKAVAVSLLEHPGMNSGFNSKDQKLVFFKTIDISVAVSTEEGIITPIIRYADCKNIGQISLETKLLAKKARDGSLKVHEFKGGSFTISNLGMYGITELYPVINPPQSSILGVGGIYEKPAIKNNKVVKSSAFMLSLSCDHRVVDGPGAAQFLKTLQKYLETPSLLLIG